MVLIASKNILVIYYALGILIHQPAVLFQSIKDGKHIADTEADVEMVDGHSGWARSISQAARLVFCLLSILFLGLIFNFPWSSSPSWVPHPFFSLYVLPLEFCSSSSIPGFQANSSNSLSHFFCPSNQPQKPWARNPFNFQSPDPPTPSTSCNRGFPNLPTHLDLDSTLPKMQEQWMALWSQGDNGINVT